MNIDWNSPAWKVGRYGVERETLRINPEGSLALSPHPAVFGDKLENQHITTDFSESQVEMITPPKTSVEQSEQALERLFDYAVTHLQGEEMFWPYSMPCVLPPGTDIPIAKYTGEQGKKAMDYRRGLLERYGGERQLISGIHYNFSFLPEALVELQRQGGNRQTLSEFQDEVYLKVARNYLRYGFAVVALLGCSNVADASFDKRVLEAMKPRKDGSFILEGGISLRNSRWGYQNTAELYPDYSGKRGYMRSVEQFVTKGHLSEPKELYAIVRPKSQKMGWEQLEGGIAYLEFRNIDIDPTVKTGIGRSALEFMHLFMLFLLSEPESPWADWQKEGRQNMARVAEQGLQPDLRLTRDGQEISYLAYMDEILGKVNQIAGDIGMPRVSLQPGGKARAMVGREFVKFGLEKAREYQREALASPHRASFCEKT